MNPVNLTMVTLMMMVASLYANAQTDKSQITETADIDKINIEFTDSVESVASGQLKTITKFPSEFVTSRRIQVWLPDGYSTKSKYAVLYMHDGQMLFDSSVTWNKQEWQVDEVASSLIGNHKTKPFIVVAIDNGGDDRRHSDYFPEKPFLSLTKQQQQFAYKQRRNSEQKVFENPVASDNYLKFLVEELKPYIDSQFSVLTDKQSTAIMGSSMGGLISMYAMFEYPHVFGAAACLSTHWPGVFIRDNNPIPDAFNQYMSKGLANLSGNRIYFDYGDQTLDAMYPPLQKRVDDIFSQYDNTLWISKYFPGEEHSERSWAKRLDIPMQFLFLREVR
ncbi:alpha/beta hydrolase-fold protein [Thalassotalea sp. Y01]|uniref:alpha/beta hydrolase n=1 Tax=Thalassotalea sp. Y01 TaxID=2729613 RepID=UPI001B7D6865|nr:alpha/beta hydrolase-fold protein [Thalassotalea sp. Y01]